MLDGNNFFLNRSGVARPPYERNQFGGTFGGPIKKDRLWFFLSYQGSREKNDISLTNSIGTVFVPQNLSNDRSTAGHRCIRGIVWIGAVCYASDHLYSARMS